MIWRTEGTDGAADESRLASYRFLIHMSGPSWTPPRPR